MIIQSHNIQHPHLLGGKASALASLSKSGANIPKWFAINGDYDAQEVIHLTQKMPTELFAVRSSALGEDGKDHSFAGQYDSFLYVKSEDLTEKINAVFQSNSSNHLKTYLHTKEITQNNHPITAIVQAMITPDVSGVAFSANPVSGDNDQTVISALWGTGSALVSGDADADTWTLKQGLIQDTTIAKKTHQHIAGNDTAEGIQRTPVPLEKQTSPCLTESQLRQVAELAGLCQQHFGQPQDIEWAIADGILYLLQSRPITTLAEQPKPTLPLTVWDNSNIAESYSGITSPLTFSFANRIYEHVYREFCLLLSVPKSRVKKHDTVFSKMLGHIHGHVYYNLNSWYHVLAMLPGFSMNRSFMEQMMGVKIPMPEQAINTIIEQTKTNKFYDALTVSRTLFGLIKNQIRLEKNIKQFYHRLESALSSNTKPLSEMSSNELISHYQGLENKLLKRWDAPLVNDFFAMIYYGVLKSLCEKWLDDSTLHNTLLLDCGEIVSAEPPRKIAEMAALVRNNTELLDILDDQQLSSQAKIDHIAKHNDFNQLLEAYLTKFGDRCLEELKLESPSVTDHPASLLSSISAMAKRPAPSVKQPSVIQQDPAKKLSRLKRKIFNWILNNARNRVRDRENLRFERTRLFGRVRQIMVELGKRLAASNQLNTSKDIFFLTIEEATSGSSKNYQELVKERISQQDDYKNQLPPPDRFHTEAEISAYTQFQSVLPYTAPSGDSLSGMGACPGIVRGKVRVVLDPREATLQEGEILVAQQTDPGWVVLFPAAAGLLVERGSLLSHSAIVARELSLPCVVSVPNITKVLKSGDIVELNGSTGTITILTNEN